MLAESLTLVKGEDTLSQLLNTLPKSFWQNIWHFLFDVNRIRHEQKHLIIPEDIFLFQFLDDRIQVG